MREEPTTNVPIPTSITIASKPYELVGLGIRQVSFLKMNVYIVSLYAQLESFRKISSILNSFESLRDGDRWAHELLNSDEVELSVRIEPVRTTNGAHLRDGFTRALMNEFKKQAGTMTEEQKEETIKSLQEFKSHFPKSSVPKHTVFTFTKLSGGILRMEYEGQTLAEIKSSWLVKQFFLNYLRSDNPVSPLARESILTGFEDAAQH
ncbi:chalcone isomerase [Paraphysoderma sedebokerense]|nr:chalcone isomerase [Paraphysoderma sedebokerense]